MADYMAAHIRIGGTVSDSLVPRLCELITDAGVTIAFGSDLLRPKTANDLLGIREDVDGVMLLDLSSDETPWGEFADLEEFLREHDIAYTRRSYGKYEHGPVVVEYRPKEGFIELPANTELKPVVVASDLAAVDTAIADSLEFLKKGSIRDGMKALQTAHRLFRDNLPPALPPLEPFQIEA